MNTIKINKTVIYIIIFLIYGTVRAQGIAFKTDGWQTIKNKASMENKLIFVDTYTTWCGPCKIMDKQVFNNKKVGDFYNTNFIPYKIDAEKVEGLDLVKTYQISSYPSYLFVDGTGRLILKKTGAMEIEEFLQLGQRILELDNDIVKMTLDYKNGNRNPEFILKYLSLLKEREHPTEEIALWYLAMVGQEHWASYESIKIVEDYIKSPYNPVMVFLAKHKEPVEIARRGGVIYTTLYNKYKEYIKVGVKNGKDQEIYQLVSKIDSVFYPQEVVYFNFLVKKEKYYRDQDWERYINENIAYANNHLIKEKAYVDLNNRAMVFYNNESITDEYALNEALKWITFVVENQKDNPYYTVFLDTQARVLSKLGRQKEALKVANKALKITEKIGHGQKGVLKLIDMIKTN